MDEAIGMYLALAKSLQAQGEIIAPIEIGKSKGGD
jgi:hypothetical protein